VYECEGYRLPTDAEWEYAARAGTTTAFYSGDIRAMGDPLDLECFSDPNLERVAWYCYNADDVTRPVMSLEPNAWGLYDSLGNAYEWVNDESDGAPAISEVDPVPRSIRTGGFACAPVGINGVAHSLCGHACAEPQASSKATGTSASPASASGSHGRYHESLPLLCEPFRAACARVHARRCASANDSCRRLYGRDRRGINRG
jgi:formylglycine-generating enzyme required for sulfatase activity